MKQLTPGGQAGEVHPNNTITMAALACFCYIGLQKKNEKQL